MYAENLKKLRYELRMSAQKLADATGISLITMQNYELAKREPKYSFLYQLLTYYNVNINWLMTGKGNMFITDEHENKGATITEARIKELFNEYMKEKGLI